MTKLFSGRVRNILLSVGINTDDERMALVEASKYSWQHFMKHGNNCGKVSIKQLSDALNAQGLDFAKDDQAEIYAAKRDDRKSARIKDAIRLLEQEGYLVTK